MLAVEAACAAAQAPADAPRAEISGGPDASGRNYEWRVTNRGPTEVVGIEFPHYGADVFYTPENWHTECSNIVNVGAVARPGLCKATAPRASDGIPIGRSVVFRMRCPAAGAIRGAGTVTVRFADGTSSEIGGVSLPVAEPLGQRYLPLIGLGALAVFFLLYKALAGRAQGGRSGRPPSVD